MDKLRNIGICMMSAILLTTILGTLAAVAELWVVMALLLFGSVIVNMVTMLIIARYLARNARTGERRAKIDTQKVAARLKQAMNIEKQANADIRDLVQTTRSEVRETKVSSQEAGMALGSQLRDLEKSTAQIEKLVKPQKHHITTTVRHSTRQIESLVHIYQRYPHVKLPMPSSGGWAIDSPALAHLLSLMEERQPKRILELGSGTSTIWVGYLCLSLGGKLVTLDHLEHYLELTRTAVRRHELNDVVESRLAPLEPIEIDGKTFQWYSADALHDLADIEMVIIDGPPAATGPQARYPALPKVIELLAPNAVIILDDAQRDDEAKIVDSWLKNYPEFKHIEQGTSGLAALERKTE